jgi:diguanylate cyclase (GGDEF)-like protein
MMGTQASRQWGRKVLVVDDDPEVIQILGVNLAHANFDVISARNGAEALAMAVKEGPDLILLDIVLPDLDGLDVCRQLKESPQTSQIPIIAISARAESEDRMAGIAAGVEQYIPKPFNPAEVVSLVQACFKRTELNDSTHPLTGLVNRTQINNRLTALIKQARPFAALYIDIDYFRVFNSVYGYDQGDQAIQLLADILNEVVQVFGNPDDLVAHCDGDDFIVISTPQKARILCQTIIANFDSRVRNLYKQKDLERGYIEYQGRLGQREQYPIMSLSAAVVTNEKRTFSNPLQVSEIASELKIYLRQFPGSNYYFDRRENCITVQPSLVATSITPAQREESKTTQGVLAWVTFLTKELETPVTVIKDCLDSPTWKQLASTDAEETNGLKAIKESTGQILHILEELENLHTFDWVDNGSKIEEVELKSILDWIMSQVRELAEQRGVEIDIDRPEDIRWITVDKSSLAQGLFYLVRNEIKSSALYNRLKIRASEANESFITVDIINQSRYIPPAELATLFRGHIDSLTSRGRRNDLYLAKVLLSGVGGELKVRSQKGEGSVFSVFIPKRRRNRGEQVGGLQSEIEASFQAVRAQLDHLGDMLLSTAAPVPAAIVKDLKDTVAKIKETEILCNRSLFLADDLSSQLEKQQAQLLKQEVEDYTTSEVLLIINRVIARLAQAKYIFDLESAKRVARNVVVIADKLGLSRSERQTLYRAALLKDLGLISAPKQLLEQKTALAPERAATVSEFFDIVREALSRISFLAPAIPTIMHQYERYDGTGYPHRLKGSLIPLGARILAPADAFDTLVIGSPEQVPLEPEPALKKLAADSGHCFDPEVVSVFLQAWREGKLQVAPNKSVSEVG